MNTTTESCEPRAQITSYRKYEVDFRWCSLEISAPVTPGTVIGYSYDSGQPVRAGLYGQVATMYFNPMHDSLMIMVMGGPERRAS